MSTGKRKLSDTKQAVDTIYPNNRRISKLLYKRARERAISLRWNVNALMFVYTILIAVIILTMLDVNSLIVASVAVWGLVVSWLFASLRLKKLENQFYQQEMHDYMELLSSEPRDNFNNEEEALGSVISTKSTLSKRELEILAQMAASKSNKEIAYALGISEMTVKNHASHIYGKLKVYDRIAAVLLALRHGWIKTGQLTQSR